MRSFFFRVTRCDLLTSLSSTSSSGIYCSRLLVICSIRPRSCRRTIMVNQDEGFVSRIPSEDEAATCQIGHHRRIPRASRQLQATKLDVIMIFNQKRYDMLAVQGEYTLASCDVFTAIGQLPTLPVPFMDVLLLSRLSHGVHIPPHCSHSANCVGSPASSCRPDRARCGRHCRNIHHRDMHSPGNQADLLRRQIASSDQTPDLSDLSNQRSELAQDRSARSDFRGVHVFCLKTRQKHIHDLWCQLRDFMILKDY